MSLYDRIIDEARALAEGRILYDPTDSQIVDAVSDILENELHGVRLGHRSIGANLAIAAFRRYDNVRMLVA